jgi:hypothetical protein
MRRSNTHHDTVTFDVVPHSTHAKNTDDDDVDEVAFTSGPLSALSRSLTTHHPPGSRHHNGYRSFTDAESLSSRLDAPSAMISRASSLASLASASSGASVAASSSSSASSSSNESTAHASSATKHAIVAIESSGVEYADEAQVNAKQEEQQNDSFGEDDEHYLRRLMHPVTLLMIDDDLENAFLEGISILSLILLFTQCLSTFLFMPIPDFTTIPLPPPPSSLFHPLSVRMTMSAFRRGCVCRRGVHLGLHVGAHGSHSARPRGARALSVCRFRQVLLHLGGRRAHVLCNRYGMR